ncbi:MAG: Ig-like domain-containing protein [Myxococcota bacterium]
MHKTRRTSLAGTALLASSTLALGCSDPDLDLEQEQEQELRGAPAVAAPYVELYEHPNYGGIKITVSQDDIAFGDGGAVTGFNDKLSSIKVFGGAKVTLYEHTGYGGSSLVIDSDDPHLASQDLYSSMRFEALPSPATRNVSFYAVADPQFDNRADDHTHTSSINRAITATETLGFLGHRVLDTSHLGILVAGDLTQNTRVHDEARWFFDTVHGLAPFFGGGTDGAGAPAAHVVRYSGRDFSDFVFETMGNHDHHAPTPLQDFLCGFGSYECVRPVAIIQAIMGRARDPSLLSSNDLGAPVPRPDYVAGRSGGVYAWRWHDVVFVALGNWAADGPSVDATGNTVPTFQSLTYLKRALEAYTADQHTPVVLMQHYPVDDPEVPVVDQEAYWEAFDGYNVVGVISGHSGSVHASLVSAPPGAAGMDLPEHVVDLGMHGLFGAAGAVGDIRMDANFMTIYLNSYSRYDDTLSLLSTHTYPIAPYDPTLLTVESIDTHRYLLDSGISSDVLFGAVELEWDFGDGSPVAIGGVTREHQYATAGTYDVELTVTTRYGVVVATRQVQVNGAPVANLDGLDVYDIQPTPANVLDNDVDPDGDVLTVVSATTTHGSVEIAADGSDVIYTAPPGFQGVDTAEYTVSDGTNESSAPLFVFIYNWPPEAVNDTADVLYESTTALSVLSNDVDHNGDLLSITGISIAPQHGTAQVQGDAIVYTAADGYWGLDSFTYTVTDGLNSPVTAEVQITVSPPTTGVDGVDLTFDPSHEDWNLEWEGATLRRELSLTGTLSVALGATAEVTGTLTLATVCAPCDPTAGDVVTNATVGVDWSVPYSVSPTMITLDLPVGLEMDVEGSTTQTLAGIADAVTLDQAFTLQSTQTIQVKMDEKEFSTYGEYEAVVGYATPEDVEIRKRAAGTVVPH